MYIDTSVSFESRQGSQIFQQCSDAVKFIMEKRPGLTISDKELILPSTQITCLGVKIYFAEGSVSIPPPPPSPPPPPPPPPPPRKNAGYLKYGHCGRVVTLSPPTSEAGVRSQSRPQVGKLVVACRWSAVYSTEA